MPCGIGSKGRSPFCHVKSRQHKARRLQSLEDLVCRELGAPYTVQHLPDMGHMVFTPVAGVGGVQTLQRHPCGRRFWQRCGASGHSTYLGRYRTPYLVEGVPLEAVWATMQPLAQPAAEGFVAMMGEGVELYGAACPLPKRLPHLYSFLPVEPVHVQQPGDAELHCMLIAVDGASRHEASYVHCTLRGTSSPDQHAMWWLLGGTKEGATLYAAAQEVDFDQQFWDAPKVVF